MEDKLKALIEQSGHRYNQEGEMYFDDDLYLTEWRFTDEAFHSRIQYLHQKPETISFPWTFGLEAIQNWHAFGFVQKFYDPQAQDLISPYHRNQHLEIYYVVKGHQEIKVEGEMICLNEKDLLLLNNQCHHSDVLSAQNMDIRILGIDLQFIDEKKLHNPAVKGFFARSLDSENQDSEYWVMRNVNLKRYFDAMADEMTQREAYYQDAVKVELLRLLDQIKAQEQSIKAFHGRKGILFNEVDQYMRHHYAEMQLEDLANHLKFSKDYFNRLIKEISGKTYTEYLQSIRMEKATEMLLETEESVQKIAEKVGYANLAYFYEVFKEHFKMTPHSYRQKIRK